MKGQVKRKEGKKIKGCTGKIKPRIVRLFEMDMYTLLYLKWVTNKDLLYGSGKSAQCYVVAWIGREFRGEWIHVYVWLSAAIN